MLPSNTKSLYKPVLLGITILLVMFLAACGGNNNNNDNAADPKSIVATYEGGTVTEKELNSYIGARKLLDQNYMYLEMMPDHLTMVLNQLIAENILSKEVSDEVAKDTKEQAKAATKSMKDNLDSNKETKTEVETFMKDNDIDFDDLENYVDTQYKLQTVLGEKYTDAEIKQKYDDNLKADPNTYTKATVRHVLVAFKDQEGNDLRTKEEALARANEAYEKLQSTGDWDKLALEYSDDGNNAVGGIYEDADVNNWVTNFKNAALNQPLNEIGKPVETEYGYHVVVVEKREVGEFEGVKSAVHSEMVNEFFLNYIQNEVPKLIVGEVNLPVTETDEAEAEVPDANTDTEQPEATPAQ